MRSSSRLRPEILLKSYLEAVELPQTGVLNKIALTSSHKIERINSGLRPETLFKSHLEAVELSQTGVLNKIALT